MRNERLYRMAQLARQRGRIEAIRQALNYSTRKQIKEYLKQEESWLAVIKPYCQRIIKQRG